MSTPKISVVLPCYHVEMYLSSIFNDLRAQTFKDFEMLFVNDGGGEKLSRMLADLESQDARVVVVDKKNGGVSSARNLGIEQAKCEWIVFVDPDDRLESFYLQTLYDAIVDKKVLLGIGGFKEYYVGQDVWCDHTLPESKNVAELKDCYYIFDKEQISAPWNKIYNAAFLREHTLRFDETKSFGEDIYFNLQLFDLIDTLAIISDCGYRYIRNVQSATQKYHANYKAAQEDVYACEKHLLLRLGETEQVIEEQYVKKSSFRAYTYVINYFKKGNHLSLCQKTMHIKKEIIGDTHLMQALHLNRYRKEGINVMLCTHLLLIRQAWLVAAIFQILFLLKNNFMGLFNWYDTHLSGKLKK